MTSKRMPRNSVFGRTSTSLKKRRAEAHLRTLAYQKAIARLYNHKGKLTPKQEGPYRVVYTIQDGTYVLVIMDGNVLPRTWHISTHR
ncbi:hypothetical protein B296_00003316 [Ensete ventricosum]|uniref:Uncharacterized protein n=1 Tax=Ensete ventricosum TaxID=4639 RepID=A0A427B5P1_ENSVE|nr:hypothetical protein B296_00003316 [Ensete ventricosum]